MAKNSDWGSGKEIQDIMERFVDRFPEMFEGFDVGHMHFIVTQKKKSREPIKLLTVGHPQEVFVGKPYIVEAFELWWKEMNLKQKNLAVFHVMCAVPQGGFDEQSQYYGKRLQPDIKMYMREFAASGGIPNWMENPAAMDPMERTAEDVANDVPAPDALPEGEDDGVRRSPVTKDTVAGVGVGEPDTEEAIPAAATA